MFRSFLIIALIGLSFIGPKKAIGQDSTKHEFFLFWGYNRSIYSKSDITMNGDGYNYTLRDVEARDKPEEFDPKVYFNILTLSIPQFNIRGGWRFKNNWSITGGYDHMKYVVKTDQTVLIDGDISTPNAGAFQGNYNQDSIQITTDFLTFEHTDGLNYISVELEHLKSLWKSKNEKLFLQTRNGADIAALYPRTDVKIFGESNPNIWNLAGFGFSLHSQMRMHFGKFFFIQTTVKGGHIFMPKIKITGNSGEWARQHFWFLEGFWAIGSRFYINKK